MAPPGVNSGCHHPGVSVPPATHGPPTMPFQSGVIHTHQGQDPTPSPTSSTPVPSSGLDITKLEERLGEVMNKKLESMTETLRASMSTSMENSSMTAANAVAKAPGPLISSGFGPSLPNVPDGTTATLSALATPDAEHFERPSMLTSKAKPPARPEETRPSRLTRTSSRKRLRPRRSRERKPSRSYSSHRRSLHRRRARSERHHRGDHGSTSPRLRHQDRPLPRDEGHSRPPKTAYSAGRDLSHPIYQRSNAMRTMTSTPGASGYRQIHSDIHKTVYARSPAENYGRDSRHQQDRTAPSITLRSRSRSKRTHRAHPASIDRGRGIHLYPRSQFEPISYDSTYLSRTVSV